MSKETSESKPWVQIVVALIVAVGAMAVCGVPVVSRLLDVLFPTPQANTTTPATQIVLVTQVIPVTEVAEVTEIIPVLPTEVVQLTEATEPTRITSTAVPSPASTNTQPSDLLPNGEVVSPESLSRLIGGDAAYWSKRGPVVWGYWNEGHNITFRHPGNNMVMTYWAGFAEPRNAEGCSVIIPTNDNLTRYVKCPIGTKAEFESDGVGLHLVDYTGLFP